MKFFGKAMSKRVNCPKCNNQWFAKVFCTFCEGTGKVSVSSDKYKRYIINEMTK